MPKPVYTTRVEPTNMPAPAPYWNVTILRDGKEVLTMPLEDFAGLRAVQSLALDAVKAALHAEEEKRQTMGCWGMPAWVN